MTLWEFKGANNAGSCYVPVGSGVQTDATYTFQQCWDLQCIVGRVQRIRLCKPCVMCVRGVVTMLEELCHSRPQSRSFVFTFVLLVTCKLILVALGTRMKLRKRIQSCNSTLRRSRNRRNVGSWWLKRLTGFKLCAATPNNMQLGVQNDATCNIQPCCELLANDAAFVGALKRRKFHYVVVVQQQRQRNFKKNVRAKVLVC